jgi:hypothetical protein
VTATVTDSSAADRAAESDDGPAATDAALPSVGRLERPLARPVGAGWAATCQERDVVWARLTDPPLGPLLDGGDHRRSYLHGLGLLLDWLEDQPGSTWQDRWMASGADGAGRAWRQIPDAWLHERDQQVGWRRDAFYRALLVSIGVDLIRPSLPWLATAAFRKGSLVNILIRCRADADFTRLRKLCSDDPDVSPDASTRTAYRAGQIVAAKGGTLADITTGDVLELLDAESDASGSIPATHLFYRVLHTMGVFGDHAPHRPHRAGHRRPAALHPARLPARVHHRRHHERPPAPHRPGHRRAP